MNDHLPSIRFALPEDPDGLPADRGAVLEDKAEKRRATISKWKDLEDQILAEFYRDDTIDEIYLAVRLGLYRAAGGFDNLSIDDIDELNIRARDIVQEIVENTPPLELASVLHRLRLDELESDQDTATTR